MNAPELEWARSVQSWWVNVSEGAPALTIIDTETRDLFAVNPFSGVTISTDQAAGIALYAGISPIQYLRLCAMLGLTQWRALERNELLVAEDLAHAEPSDCVFTRRPRKSDYALALEQPSLCYGCFDFYHCLGADTEIVALAEMLRSLQATTPGSPLLPVLR